eukprot:5484411-Pyramimonas_sp.AAC.1
MAQPTGGRCILSGRARNLWRNRQTSGLGLCRSLEPPAGRRSLEEGSARTRRRRRRRRWRKDVRGGGKGRGRRG